MRTAHFVFASILTAAAADADSGGGLGAHSVDAFESRWRLEGRLDAQRRAQAGLVYLPPGEGVSNRHPD